MGKIVHEYIDRNKVEIAVKLGTSLVDMYAKYGDIENSLKVFNGMGVKDVLTWSAVIIRRANHGFGEHALDYLAKIISGGIKANDITFIGVLSACSHVGVVDRGWTYFTSMNDKYGVTPKIEHYGCMVDLLGRMAHLREARELIRNMPFAPDAIVWRTFISACKIHKNMELVEEATVNLLELEPHMDGNYVLLSNMYAQGKKWDDVVNVRRRMRDKNIHKIPGSSSIEVDNVVYEFIAGYRSHPKSKEIYEMLAEMIEQLISSVLQDMNDKAKEHALAYHNEKLAFAFGLLSSWVYNTDCKDSPSL
ncbi:hypothetical protein IFM89_029565 [Coptis chinensis]|uniref:Pentatricopeptide repeat-containing protein n=1 Tax=Coptis chinensis TaxID=261450 RepID=A0A835GYT2_9MAGN|nr:hypothetical protein IFM89_029565 [Coptis chinensis]